jgi:hypothetical protein
MYSAPKSLSFIGPFLPLLESWVGKFCTSFPWGLGKPQLVLVF